MRTVTITNHDQPKSKPIHAGYCDSFISRFRGYMFARAIQRQEGLLLVEPRESRANTSIHMLFMNFDLAVIWINADLEVVDACLAYRWRPYYAPARPARYTLETHPDHLAEFRLGDHVSIRDE
jgi:uncharacterized membrane protein (UPF0127 family)